MLVAPKTDDMSQANWQPATTLSALQQRAKLYQQIRQFMLERGIMEVDTPCLSSTGVTDPNIENLSVSIQNRGDEELYFLQTSPEYFLKRLLAFGSDAIYQIGHVFRANETGRLHNPEFTLLEWYRPGFDHIALIDEMEKFFLQLKPAWQCQRFTYQQVFIDYAGIDPLNDDYQSILSSCEQLEISVPELHGDKDALLDLLMCELVAPKLGVKGPCFVYNYPASQASLARLDVNDQTLAERFEVFIDGIEIANGFHELTDAAEQRQRFEQDQFKRALNGQEEREIDERLLTALASGFPDCAGVAVGLDRLLMVLHAYTTIKDVLAFPLERA